MTDPAILQAANKIKADADRKPTGAAMSVKIILEIEGQEPAELEFADETWRALLEIVKRNGITMEQAIAQALANENYIESQIDDPSTKLLVAKGDQLRELVLQ